MDIINWENVFSESENFQNRYPTKWAYVEEFLNRDFYEGLYQTYPKFDDTWYFENSYDKSSYRKYWKKDKEYNGNIITEYDDRYNDTWNKFMNHMWSKEFIKKLVDFSRIDVTNLKQFCFLYIKKDGFQLPHIHDVSDKTLMIFLYLAKNWKEGAPGATYLSDGRDESKIVFEPYNLDNSALIVLDGPEAAHGVRKITEDVERRAIQFTYEPYSPTEGWYGDVLLKNAPEPIDL